MLLELGIALHGPAPQTLSLDARCQGEQGSRQLPGQRIAASSLQRRERDHADSADCSQRSAEEQHRKTEAAEPELCPEGEEKDAARGPVLGRKAGRADGTVSGEGAGTDGESKSGGCGGSEGGEEGGGVEIWKGCVWAGGGRASAKRAQGEGIEARQRRVAKA